MGEIDAFLARSLSDTVHRLFALTAFIIIQHKELKFLQGHDSLVSSSLTRQNICLFKTVLFFPNKVDPFHNGLVNAHQPEARQASCVARSPM